VSDEYAVDSTSGDERGVHRSGVCNWSKVLRKTAAAGE